MIEQILVAALIKVACKDNGNIDKCEEYIAQCYTEGIAYNEGKRYEFEYRKALIITKCIDKLNKKDGVRR